MELFFSMLILLNPCGILAFEQESINLHSNENANIETMGSEANNRGGKRK